MQQTIGAILGLIAMPLFAWDPGAKLQIEN
jgi:hypothetical protein